MTVQFTVDGKKFEVPADITLAAALYFSGLRIMRKTPRNNDPRALFCGMGVCYDCVVKVDGRANVRSCQTTVRQNMSVFTQNGEPNLEDSD
ncbi:MAG: putative molibdopterin-dependent oxidoreductase YjgC [Gammaproteobacteria bacterium]|jgi:predicted molibdopterin-dependent oxidoreductase YjgC|tara:strand:- start:228 stop:500 length:273 start_codon:yes stop_codon:yes gene_type:complete